MTELSNRPYFLTKNTILPYLPEGGRFAGAAEGYSAQMQYSYQANKCGLDLYVSHKNSPNKVLAQANQDRVNFFASSL